MNCNSDYLDGNCGVDVAYNFQYGTPDPFEYTGRTELVVCGFVNNKQQKDAYECMCKHYKLLFQSPLRMKSDGNPKGYFLCVFDRKK